ncbi:MAG: hydrogenase formation protein HypD [Gammaproteobacteria bacterium]|nr:hydrogenase formation protein HypD [Gammaproteobacteria bacterium]
MNKPGPRDYLRQIRASNIPPLRIMNVCGGHERSISLAGLRYLLPAHVQLIPGPGCPVCVCPEEDIRFAVQLSFLKDTIVTSFGDMLRVPLRSMNGSTDEIYSLESARQHGGRVIPIASPLDVLSLAEQHPEQNIVFFVVGFETTLAPVAAMLAQGLPANVRLLVSAKRTAPIVQHLLQSTTNNIDALIAPGHVATIMGTDEWRFVSEQYRKPCAVAGFDQLSVLSAINAITQQHHSADFHVENCYRGVARAEGNPFAIATIERFFDIDGSRWRGIGRVENSGFRLKPEFKNLDTHDYYASVYAQALEETGKHDMPRACACGKVVMGSILPHQCKLYGATCTPESPAGPCMVSSEGACHIWWQAAQHRPLEVGLS